MFMNCENCTYKKQAEKYKQKYEIARCGLSKEERDMIVDMICAEQLKYMIVKEKYNSEEYKNLEKLKIKIRTV